jgi:hypothetical protein
MRVPIDIDTLRKIFDTAVGSLNFTSGFLDQEEVNALIDTAKILGVPVENAIPDHMREWYERNPR